jgi:hypothetical protein
MEDEKVELERLRKEKEDKAKIIEQKNQQLANAEEKVNKL